VTQPPIVASYCTTFLKPEMLHIYRQVTGLQRYRTFIMGKQRLCEDRYPFDDIELLPKRRHNLLRHGWLKYVKHAPPFHYRGHMEPFLGILNRRSPALMHIYFGHTGAHLLPFIELWERPCIVSFHGADVMAREDRPRYFEELNRLFAAVPLILARSHSLAKRLKSLGCPSDKLRINRTGIPLDDFPFTHRQAPDDGAWRIVQSCRFIPKKGIRTALQAFAIFHRTFPNATYTLAGDGPMRDELRQLAAELGIAQAVHFAGFLDQRQLNALYAASHLFLHPSETTANHDQEGVPNAMLEAMATGLPVVATLHGGIPEAVQHDASGLLVAERDHEALAAALLGITRDPEALFTMGEHASRSIHAEFEQQCAVARLESFYDEAVATHTPVA